METYNSNEMMSLGEAETFEGENVSSPLAPPTTTLITFGTAEELARLQSSFSRGLEPLQICIRGLRHQAGVHQRQS